ncbi:MAG: hypothetical protein M1833_000319 [Piccolia ochrophora]|nr:MAG: hypothetical protein M1833_000319 [Piccolia ochrophora]
MLLNELKFATNEQKEHLELGKVPIVFVTHSMGGIVLKKMILERDSSTLGYPEEIAKPLTADHHDVCKYTSTQDPNYRSVRDVLISLSSHAQKDRLNLTAATTIEEMRQIELVLATSEAPENDFEFFNERRMEQSGEWILDEEKFKQWRDDPSPASSFLWMRGPPGIGKSVLSTVIIQHLRHLEKNCRFFFFRFGDVAKRSPGALLRSLAFQVAQIVPEFRSLLAKLSESNIRLESQEARVVWQKIFAPALLNRKITTPLYWVIDGIDECESPQSLVKIFSGISTSIVPIRVLLVGRSQGNLSAVFDKIKSTLPVTILTIEEMGKDIHRFITHAIEDKLWEDELKDRIIEEVQERAQNNFLWVSLVMAEIAECYTANEIESVLNEVPAGMESIYAHMAATIVSNSKEIERALAKTILAWTVCSRRTFKLAELSLALEPDFPSIMDLRGTIDKICGHFVVVDKYDNIALVHQTARKYLTATPGLHCVIDSADTHRVLFLKCLAFLFDPDIRKRLEVPSDQSFLLYPATSWSYHLSLSAAKWDSKFLDALVKLFRGPFALNWIYFLALKGQLRYLIFAAKELNAFSKQRAEVDAEQMPLLHRFQDRELLESWAVDLVKIVGWDDCLSTISLGRDCHGLSVKSAGRRFATLATDQQSGSGVIVLYDTDTHEGSRQFFHKERVMAICFDHEGNSIASYGTHSTKIWSVYTGELMFSFRNSMGVRVLDICFTNADRALMVGAADKIIRTISLDDIGTGWESMDSVIKDEVLDGRFYNDASRMSFSPDGALVAVAYRAFPLSVWAVNHSHLIGRCERLQDQKKAPGEAWSYVDQVCWNAATGHILGLYNEGAVFKWQPYEGEYVELDTVASVITCSQDGVFFGTGTTSGIIRIWNFQYCAILYQLDCHTMVKDLTFSFDSRRLLELRESSCNVWEPNTLIRLSEAEERGSESFSETTSMTGSTTVMSTISEASSTMFDPITTLAIQPHTGTFAVGNDNGLIVLLDHVKGMIQQLWRASPMMAITHLVWSDDGKFLASADLSGDVIIKSIKSAYGNANKRSLRDFCTLSINSNIQDLLLESSSERLLIVTENAIELWSTATKTMLTKHEASFATAKLINHPHHKDLIICFRCGTVELYSWVDLTQVATLPFETHTSQAVSTDRPGGGSKLFRRTSQSHGDLPTTPLTDTVDRVLVAPGGHQIMAALSIQGQVNAKEQTKDIVVFRSLDLVLGGPPRDASPSTLDPLNQALKSAQERPRQDSLTFKHRPEQEASNPNNSPDQVSSLDAYVLFPQRFPPSMATRIEIPLGFLASPPTATTTPETFAFLDSDYWVCTTPLPTSTSSATEGVTSGTGSLRPPLGRMQSTRRSIAEATRRHFFFPRDWLNVEALRLAAITEEGTVLCPRNGEVARIRNWAREEW